MATILDIHTHHPVPQPQGVVSVSPIDFSPIANQLYSVGFHPWDTTNEIKEQMWDSLLTAAANPAVAAIGETGVDLTKGGPLFRQMQIFKKHIEISEQTGKPLIIHDVKAHDIIIGIKKDMNPKMPWVVHGFRNKPTVAKMLTDCGIYLSYGQKFNPESLAITPEELLLAETDEAPLTIEEVVISLSESLKKDISGLIARNTSKFLKLPELSGN